MKNRSELREVIMKVLYQVFMMEEAYIKYNVDELIEEQLEVENDFVKEIVYGVIKNKKKLYAIADKHLKDWECSRLSIPDQAIIASAIYELKETDTPSIVVINEAIELAKKYSDDKVVKMINACLDSIYHDKENNG
jgi:transcription antitermination factor nusB